MRRSTSIWVVVAAAALLAVGGCSSSVDGSPQAGSPVAASTTGSTAASTASSTATSTTRSSPRTSTSQRTTDETTSDETETSEDTTTSDETETSDRTTSPSSELDPETVTWFATFCTQAADFQQYASPDTTGQTLTEAQITVADAYSNLSISASTTVGVLQATPPPPIDGGDDLQTGLIERFSAFSDVYGRGALTILGLSPTSESDLVDAIDAIEAEAGAAVPDVMANVDSAVVDAARELPECQGVL